MTDFVQLWVYLSTTPLFGLTATLLTYLVAQALYQFLDQAPWANPVLWTVLLLASMLSLSGTPYPSYFSGAQFIHFLLGPAVVSLAWLCSRKCPQRNLRWPTAAIRLDEFGQLLNVKPVFFDLRLSILS